MTRKLSRRDFLKTAGAATLAIAAMGTLTACGGGGSSSADKPTTTPTTPSKESVLGGLKVTDADNYVTRWVNANKVPYAWSFCFNAKLHNTGDKELEIKVADIKAKLDGADRMPDVVYEVNGNDLTQIDESTIILGVGQSMEIEIDYMISETAYKEWKGKTGTHSFEITLTHDGKKVKYSVDGSFKATLSSVENA